MKVLVGGGLVERADAGGGEDCSRFCRSLRPPDDALRAFLLVPPELVHHAGKVAVGRLCREKALRSGLECQGLDWLRTSGV